MQAAQALYRREGFQLLAERTLGRGPGRFTIVQFAFPLVPADAAPAVAVGVCRGEAGGKAKSAASGRVVVVGSAVGARLKTGGRLPLKEFRRQKRAAAQQQRQQGAAATVTGTVGESLSTPLPTPLPAPAVTVDATDGVERVLSLAQLETFARDGVLVVPGILSAGELARARDGMRATLRTHGFVLCSATRPRPQRPSRAHTPGTSCSGCV